MLKVTERKSRFGLITILQTKQTGSLIYSQDDYFQSEADARGTSLTSYIHALYGLVRQSGAADVLMIGCGGGTLATMLNKSGCRVSVVDINAQAFRLARQYFALPNEVVCRIADGCSFLVSEDQTFDAIVLDAYDGDQIPQHLRSPAFFELAARRLNPNGAVFINVHVRNDLDDAADRIAADMTHAWNDVRILDWRGEPYRNAIVMGGSVKTLAKPVLMMEPEISAHKIQAELDAMQFRSFVADD